MGVFACAAALAAASCSCRRALLPARLRVPRRRVIAVGRSWKNRPHQDRRGIGLQDGVVHVPGFLVPGIEDDLLVGVVRVDGRDHAPGRVVAHDGADPHLNAELEVVALVGSWLKNGSYWRTGLPLLLKMVQPLPTQRGSTTGPPSTTGPGSAWIFFWISRPKPSE